MSVYKEGYHFLKEIKNNLTRIYDDAADMGVPVKKGDRFWNMAKQMADWYGVKETRKELLFEGIVDHSVSINVELMDEWAVSDGDKTAKEATETYVLEYFKCNRGQCKGFDGYIYIWQKQIS